MGGEGGDASFADRIEALFSDLERALDRLPDELDVDVLRAGNVLTLTFENNHCLIVNSQEAAKEVWVAARSGGFHFRYDASTKQWLDTRSGEDLRIALGRLVETESGVATSFHV